jgi:hypothetical protein
MTTICLIGDSHLASLKLGWDAMQHNYQNIELTFFGAPHRIIDGLAVSGHALVATTDLLRRKFNDTSGGKSEIAGDYDCYIVNGLGIAAHRVLKLYGQCRAESYAQDERQPISDECFHWAFYGCLRESRAVRIIGYLREITTAPIGLVPMPMRSTSSPNADVEIIEQNGDEASVATAFAATATRLSEDLNFSLLLQPEDTLAAPLRTNAIFSRASLLSAADEVESRDYTHMNANYGKLVLRKIFSDFAHLSSMTVSCESSGIIYDKMSGDLQKTVPPETGCGSAPLFTSVR